MNPISEKPLPCTLESFGSALFMFPYRELPVACKEQGFKGLTKIVAVVQDGSGREHHGSHKINIDEWGNS